MLSRVHISVKVSDLDRSLAFYQGLFGVPASKVKPGYANFRLDTPAIHLALNQAAAPLEGGRHGEHFGIELMSHDDLASWRTRLEEAGLPLRLEDDVTCCYARADKVWAQDPDGNAWELWVRKADSETPNGERVNRCCA